MKEHYILQFPFTSAAGNNIDTLQLRRLKVKDMRNARRISEKPEEWDEPLMAAMTGLVPEDLAEMDLLGTRCGFRQSWHWQAVCPRCHAP